MELCSSVFFGLQPSLMAESYKYTQDTLITAVVYLYLIHIGTSPYF